jgi:hypothetical protein
MIFSEITAKTMELRALIIQDCSETTEDICRRVISNVTVSAEGVAKRNGAHVEHFAHRG